MAKIKLELCGLRGTSMSVASIQDSWTRLYYMDCNDRAFYMFTVASMHAYIHDEVVPIADKL